MPFIEMKDLSKTNKQKNSQISGLRIYKKFPFFAGAPVKLLFNTNTVGELPKIYTGHFDYKALIAHEAYKALSEADRLKFTHQIGKTENTLVNQCCNTIVKQLLENPDMYVNRVDILPASLNEAIDEKLEDIQVRIKTYKV